MQSDGCGRAGSHAPAVRPPSARLDALLAAALRHGAARRTPAQVAVGVIDLTTGQQALYHAAAHFRAASILTADILAALLFRHQQAGTTLTQPAGRTWPPR